MKQNKARHRVLRKSLKWAAAGAMVVGLLGAAQWLPVDEWMEVFTRWVAEHGVLGKLLFVVGYVLGTVLCFWGLLFTIAGGIAFGVLWGTLLSWLGSTLGAIAAFLLARHLARGAIEKRLQRNEKYKALDAAIAERGWKVVVLLRLNPVLPFNFSNYLYGLTQIRFWPYVLASMAAMLPGTFLYTYLGHVGRLTLTRDASLGSMHYVFLGVGLGAAGLTVLYLGQAAKKKLDDWRRGE